jgi:hypothetical protein
VPSLPSASGLSGQLVVAALAASEGETDVPALAVGIVCALMVGVALLLVIRRRRRGERRSAETVGLEPVRRHRLIVGPLRGELARTTWTGSWRGWAVDVTRLTMSSAETSREVTVATTSVTEAVDAPAVVVAAAFRTWGGVGEALRAGQGPSGGHEFDGRWEVVGPMVRLDEQGLLRTGDGKAVGVVRDGHELHVVVDGSIADAAEHLDAVACALGLRPAPRPEPATDPTQ